MIEVSTDFQTLAVENALSREAALLEANPYDRGAHARMAHLFDKFDQLCRALLFG